MSDNTKFRQGNGEAIGICEVGKGQSVLIGAVKEEWQVLGG